MKLAYIACKHASRDQSKLVQQYEGPGCRIDKATDMLRCGTMLNMNNSGLKDLLLFGVLNRLAWSLLVICRCTGGLKQLQNI